MDRSTASDQSRTEHTYLNPFKVVLLASNLRTHLSYQARSQINLMVNDWYTVPEDILIFSFLLDYS